MFRKIPCKRTQCQENSKSDFLSNNENKDMLCDILLQVWSDDSFSTNIHGRKVSLIYICHILQEHILHYSGGSDSSRTGIPADK